jgi:DNA-binding beta-propeller fold protein YncE
MARPPRWFGLAVLFYAACAGVVGAPGLAADSAAQIINIPAHDHPFTAQPSADGRVLFVSVERDHAKNGILVIHRDGSTYRPGTFIPVDGDPTGLALTPDGRTLLIAAGSRYAALSASAAENDTIPPVTYLQSRDANGAIEAISTLDGTTAFFTNEVDASISIVSIGVGPDGTIALSQRGRIGTDRAPVGMALSPDGARLFVTSEASPGHPADCIVGRFAGSIAVIDVHAAITTTDHATLSTVIAGCSPVRIALAPDGNTAWVTLRGENAIGIFDTAKLVSDPHGALLRKIVVGNAPVGISLAKNGRLAFVANSNRFDAQSTTSNVVVLNVAAALSGNDAASTSFPTGAFPREIRESPQHDVVYVTNYLSGTVEAIPVP